MTSNSIAEDLAQAKVPESILERFKELIEKSPLFNIREGIPIKLLTEKYNSRHSPSITAQEFGFSTWENLFGSGQFTEFCEVFYDEKKKHSSIKPKVADKPKKVVPPPPSLSTPSSSISSVNIKPPLPMEIVSDNESVKSDNSTTRAKRPPPAPGHLDWSGSEVGIRKNKIKTDAASNASSSKKSKYEESQMSQDDDMSVCESVMTLAPEKKTELRQEQRQLRWILRDQTYGEYTFDILTLGRKMGIQENQQFVDTTFCDRDILQRLMDVKYNIRDITTKRFFDYRAQMNEFETQEAAIFKNGSALRMANIDAISDYAFTNPKNRSNQPFVEPNDILFFADILGGPGGFAEYILWKKKWECKGYGFNPRTSAEFDPYDLPSRDHYHKESFEAFYDLSNTVNIFDPECIGRFVNHVRRFTSYKGVHVVLADGGERNNKGDEDQKEINCKMLFMIELMIAIKILRVDGTLLMKIYDVFTPFTAGLIYLIYRAFDQVAIYRPETSVPASSERYVIAKFKKNKTYVLEIANYLDDCIRTEWNTGKLKFKHERADILELVPVGEIKESPRFFEYLRKTNVQIGKLQLQETSNLIKAISSNNVTGMAKNRHRTILSKANTLWKIPETLRISSKMTSDNVTIRAAKLFKPYPEVHFSTFVQHGEMKLNMPSLEDEIQNPNDWYAVPVGKERGFYLSMGDKGLYRFGGAKWSEVPEKIELANNTLVYADMVDEMKIAGDKQEISTGFHIIDAVILGGKDIRYLPYNERVDLCSKFARSMNKMSRIDIGRVRMKMVVELSKVEKSIEKIKMEVVRAKGHCPTIQTDEIDNHPPTFALTGYLLIRTRKDEGSHGDFMFTMSNRVLWEFSTGVDLDLDRQATGSDKKLHASTVVSLIKSRMPIPTTAAANNK